MSRPLSSETPPEHDTGGVIDYSHELRLSTNPALRGLFLGLGLLATGLGVIGVFVPGWPTTVWLLVATFFFARSSPKLYNRLLNHRLFGPLIRDFRAGHGIPLRAKIMAIAMIVLFAGSSALLFIGSIWGRLLVLGVAAVGVIYLLWLPTKSRPTHGAGDVHVSSPRAR